MKSDEIPDYQVKRRRLTEDGETEDGVSAGEELAGELLVRWPASLRGAATPAAPTAPDEEEPEATPDELLPDDVLISSRLPRLLLRLRLFSTSPFSLKLLDDFHLRPDVASKLRRDTLTSERNPIEFPSWSNPLYVKECVPTDSSLLLCNFVVQRFSCRKLSK